MKTHIIFAGLALAMLAPLTVLAKVPLASSQELGKAEGRCRDGEQGPAILVEASGLKDRKGLMKLEVYPANDDDFLQDDNILLNAGKVFRRVEQDLPDSGPVVLCVRVPTAGAYAIVLLHDRDSNHKFGWWGDGAGLSGNPKLGLKKPRAALATINAGNGLTRTAIVLNYRHGLGIAPIRAN
ncbi:MAG: hypothetical protein RLY97_961 [Pseudomonadota bacterium]|jgi:uncharacterized protein (DUF2141 family)